MKDIKKFPGWYYLYLGLSAALLVAYLYLTFNAPQVPGRFNLTPDQNFAIKVSVVLPLMAIWLIGTLAVTAFARYIGSISGSLEERGFLRIEAGIIVLLTGLLIGWVVGAIKPFYAGVPDIPDVTVILIVINNYINVFMPLLAFGLIFMGADHLASHTKNTISSFNFWPMVLSVVATLFYVWVIFSNPNRQFGLGPDHSGAFYLSDAMLVLTLMLPYVIMWTLGIFAAARITEYRSASQGNIYRSALTGIRNGIVFIVALSITFQALSLLSSFFAAANLNILLIVVYLILLAMSGGYIMLYLSARKLNLIETV